MIAAGRIWMEGFEAAHDRGTEADAIETIKPGLSRG
jgi:hypothetical protein